MNRTKIEWVKNSNGMQGYTWNPITGCQQGCSYCYARRIARRFGKTQEEKDFKPVFHLARLGEPQKIKKPSTIFVCSMADLFGAWVLDEQITKVLIACRAAPQHRYLFLTKNPGRYEKFIGLWPEKYMVGVTITKGSIPKIKGHPPNRIFVSAEPLLGEVMYIWATRLCWLIVGTQTGSKRIESPINYFSKRADLNDLRDLCDLEGIAFFMKDNLKDIWQGKGLYPRRELIQEFPPGLRKADR